MPFSDKEHVIAVSSRNFDAANETKPPPATSGLSPTTPSSTLTSPPKSKFLSITCLSVLITTGLIALTVAVVLSVSVVFSLKAADDFAEKFSRASVTAAINKVNDFVVIPLNAYTQIAASTDYGYLPNLVNGSEFTEFIPFLDNNTNASAISAYNDARLTMYRKWVRLFHAMMYASNFKLSYVATGLADRSWVACNVEVGMAPYSHSCYFTDPQNITSPFYAHYETYEDPLAEDESLRMTYYDEGILPYDPTSRPWYVNAPRGKRDLPVFSDIYVDAGLGVPIVDVNGPLFAVDGTFLGITSISLDLQQISEFLSELPRTGRTLTILLDGKGFMLGASDKGRLSASFPYDPSTDTLGDECEEYNGLQVCRLTPANYGHRTLAKLYTSNRESDVFAHDGSSFTRHIKIGGKQWMVSKAPITARSGISEGVIHWLMVTLMPVSDVTESIVTGRDIGIIIACVMVVFSCCVCALALIFLLRPLSTLAGHIEQASKHLDGTRENELEKSRLRELRTIQDAYERLSQQLQRAKSFLPAALVAQLESSTDEEANEADEDELADDETRQTAYTSSQVSRENTHNNKESSTVGDTNTRKDTHSTQRIAGKVRRKAADTLSRFTSYSQSRANTVVGDQQAPSTRVIASAIGMSYRTVTVAALNLRHFHLANAPTPTSLSAASTMMESVYGKLVDNLHTIAKEGKGILDSFHGDRFFFTFNAVKNCSAHGPMAAIAMVKASATIQAMHQSEGAAIPADKGVSCGIATGRCKVGNLGSDKAKRFTVVGPTFTYATVLERLCKRYPDVSVLVAEETANECETHVGLLVVDYIATPHRDDRPSVISSAVYLKNAAASHASPLSGDDSQKHNPAGDEWMYELMQASERCDYHAANSAFRAAVKGELDAASSFLETFKDSGPQSRFVRKRIEGIIAQQRLRNFKQVSPSTSLRKETEKAPNQGKQQEDCGARRYAADLGLFYDFCILDKNNDGNTPQGVDDVMLIANSEGETSEKT